MITREEAVQFLYRVMDSELISEEAELNLQEIANCIDGENDSLHLWGVPDKDVQTLYTSVREDLITDAYKAELDRLYQLYRFYPSKFEEDELIAEQDGEDDEQRDDSAE